MSIDAGELTRARQLLVATRILRRRKALGLTQQACADLLAKHGYEITDGTWSNLEKGIGLDVGKLVAVALALECSTTYLLGLTDTAERWEPDGDVEVAASRVKRKGRRETSYRQVPMMVALSPTS